MILILIADDEPLIQDNLAGMPERAVPAGLP